MSAAAGIYKIQKKSIQTDKILLFRIWCTKRNNSQREFGKDAPLPANGC